MAINKTESQESSFRNGFWLGLKLLAVGLSIAVGVLVKEIILLGFISILLSVLMSFPVDLLSKRIPRGIAVILTLLLFLGGIGAIGSAILPKISDQFHSVVQQLPKAADQIEDWYSKLKRSEPVSQLPQGGQIADRLSKRVGTWIESGLKGIIPATMGAFELLGTFAFLLILAVFLVYQPKSYQNAFRSLLPRDKEEIFDETYRRIGRGLRHWLGGILVSMFLMGIFTGIGLALAGIDDWFLLATLTFFGTFVPYLGAIASAIPGLLIGLSQSPQQFFFACLVYLGVHLMEGYIVQPLIMKRAVELRPAFLLFGQGILGSLFGVLGIIVAAPLLASIQLTTQYLYVERRLGKTQKEKKGPPHQPAAT